MHWHSMMVRASISTLLTTDLRCFKMLRRHRKGLISYTRHRITNAAAEGSIGANQTGAGSAGLHLHSTLVVTTERLPLGLLRAQFHAPVSRVQDDKRASADIPIEEKKTYEWIEGVRDCVALAPQIPDTQMVCVMDRASTTCS